MTASTLKDQVCACRGRGCWVGGVYARRSKSKSSKRNDRKRLTSSIYCLLHAGCAGRPPISPVIPKYSSSNGKRTQSGPTHFASSMLAISSAGMPCMCEEVVGASFFHLPGACSAPVAGLLPLAAATRGNKMPGRSGRQEAQI